MGFLRNQKPLLMGLAKKEYSNVVRIKDIFTSKTERPVYRKLRCYAFDPSLSNQLDTSAINLATFRIRWEDVTTGPVGDYIEVIDIDPASDLFYEGVFLDDPYILAKDGLTPSEGDPKFHQQMVYAVAMRTIENFEKALGRKALWSGRYNEKKEGDDKDEFVEHLRIYPHALREANAYYSPTKKALLFGYFPASTTDVNQHMPGGMVFTCLSQDIIAHETTHALLDGMHRRFIEATHPDTLAFHEAFSDLVALFQHFSMPEVLGHQIAKTKGNLSSQNLLGELAQQFGKAIGHYGALRSAIGSMNETTNQWEMRQPDPNDYNTIMEPHARGAILVSAVFEAFISIYNLRTKDLSRVASGGSGILPEGELHPTLVKLLSSEAAKSANHVLAICIRALDYCPPVDINFGDYLRAIITADSDLVPDDDLYYRIAFVDAFKKRGIIPKGLKTLSVETLVYPAVRVGDLGKKIKVIGDFLKDFQHRISYENSRREIYNLTKEFRAKLHFMLTQLESSSQLSDLTGLLFRPSDADKYELDTGDFAIPKFEVHSLRMARRVGPDGDSLNQVIISITQRRQLQKSDWIQLIDKSSYVNNNIVENTPEDIITFRGGSTIIIDLDKNELKYCINKPIIDNERLEAQVKYQKKFASTSLSATYFAQASAKNNPEPLAMLHRF
jgi:hypothetical protein